MPTLDSEIRGFVVGDYFEVERDVSGIPNPTTLTKAWLTVKAREDDEDVDAIFLIDITTSYVTGKGQIVDNGAGDGVGTVRFEVTSVNSVKMTGAKVYYFDIQVLTSAGFVFTPERGTISGYKQITRATS